MKRLTVPAVVLLVTGLFTSTLAAAEPIVGTLQSKPARAPTNHAAGLRIATMELGWDRYEPRPGAFDDGYVAEVKQKLGSFRDAGMQIMLDLGMQYPPGWVFELPHSRFMNQYGQAYDGGGHVGANGVNAVFNDAVRRRQAAYVDRVFQDLGGEFFAVRLGWGYYGELQYPTHRFGGNVNCYWAFDEVAQGRSPGLPPTMAACPVPGWKPGDASDGHHAASVFLDWYFECLDDYHDWQIGTVRQHFDGPLAVLYPSWGVRPGQAEAAVVRDLAGKTPPERNGELQRGYDFKRFIRGIDDPKVIVYTTWIDANPDPGGDPSDNPARWSPARYLSHLARNHPLRLKVMGENTGPGTVEALHLSVQRVRAYGFDGLLWAFEDHLYDAAPGHATLEQMREAIQTLPSPRAVR